MLNVSLAFEDESETKAVTAYTAAQEYEKAVNSVQVLVFDESGKINFEGIFKQFYKNGYKDFVVEIETPRDLRNKTNADGSKYTQDQIAEEMFKAAKKSAEYLQNAKFVK